MKSFKLSIAKLKNTFGSNLNDWQWGELHSIQPTHPFGKKSVLAWMNLPKHGLAGGLDSVWKAHFNLNDDNNPFKTVAGPVVRFSIDLAKPSEAMFGIDTGQSGWPTSPHYGDQYKKWIKGDLLPMEQNWDELAKKYSKTTMTLTP